MFISHGWADPLIPFLHQVSYNSSLLHARAGHPMADVRPHDRTHTIRASSNKTRPVSIPHEMRAERSAHLSWTEVFFQLLERRLLCLWPVLPWTFQLPSAIGSQHRSPFLMHQPHRKTRVCCSWAGQVVSAGFVTDACLRQRHGRCLMATPMFLFLTFWDFSSNSSK